MRFIDWLMMGALFILCVFSSIDTETQNEETKTYCEMVEMFNQTGGDYGWPDYKETFDKECVA